MLLISELVFITLRCYPRALADLVLLHSYPGLKGVLGIFCGMLAVIALQVVNLAWLNKRKEAQRVKNGKPAKMNDRSMDLKVSLRRGPSSLSRPALVFPIRLPPPSYIATLIQLLSSAFGTSADTFSLPWDSLWPTTAWPIRMASSPDRPPS